MKSLIMILMLIGFTASATWLAMKLDYDIPVVTEALADVDFHRTSCVIQGGRFSLVEESWLNITLQWSASRWLDFQPGGTTFRSSDQPAVLSFPMSSIRNLTFGSDAVDVEILNSEAVGGVHRFRNPDPDCRTTFTTYAGVYPKLLMRSF